MPGTRIIETIDSIDRWFDEEYLRGLSARTGFPASSLGKQLAVIYILREIRRDPYLKNRFVLDGGTAINLLWIGLPRLSTDIVLNYVGPHAGSLSPRERYYLQTRLFRLLDSLYIGVRREPDKPAGVTWNLMTGERVSEDRTLDLKLNYMMAIPVWGTCVRQLWSPEPALSTDFPTLSIEELYAGRVTALMERPNPRALYDLFIPASGSVQIDVNKLRKAVILFAFTHTKNGCQWDCPTIEAVTPALATKELFPLLRSRIEINFAPIISSVVKYVRGLLPDTREERLFLETFFHDAIYEMQLLFDNPAQAEELSYHPALLCMAKDRAEYLGLPWG